MLLTRKDLAMASANAAVTLIDPARLSPKLRRGYRTAIAATTAVASGYMTNQGEHPVPLIGQIAFGAGVGGALYSSMGMWERMDAGMVAWLRRRGMKRPRVALAGVALGLSLGATVLERWVDQDEHDEPDLTELPDAP